MPVPIPNVTSETATTSPNHFETWWSSISGVVAVAGGGQAFTS